MSAAAIPFSTLPVNQGGRYDTTKYPPGAGRFVDVLWPDPYTTLSTSSSVLQARNRLANTPITVVVGSFGGGASVILPIANTTMGATIGCSLLPFISGGNGSGQLARFGNGPFIPFTEKVAKTKVLAQYNDAMVSRIYSNYAYSAFAGGGALDSGLQVTSTGGLLVTGPTPGVGFIRLAAGVIEFIVVNAALAVSATVVTSAATFDDTILHSYEVIFISAQPGSKAQVMALIDGVVVKVVTSTDAVFPTFSGGTLAYVPQMFNIQGGTTLFAAASCGMRIISGPTLASCY